MRAFEKSRRIEMNFINKCLELDLDTKNINNIVRLMDSYMQDAAKHTLTNIDKAEYWKCIRELIDDNNIFDMWQFYGDFNSFELNTRDESNHVYVKEYNVDYEARISIHSDTYSFEPKDLYMPVPKDEIDNYLEDNGLLDANYGIYNLKCDSEALEKYMRNVDIENLYELNYFFKLYSEMDKETKNVFNDALALNSLVKMKDIINLTANLCRICIINIGEKAELGEFLVENGMFRMQFDNETLPYLDYEKIAEEHIKTHKGKMMNGYYAEDTALPDEKVEIYDGEHIPDFDMNITESELKM